jgi:hypothetical protein
MDTDIVAGVMAGTGDHTGAYCVTGEHTLHRYPYKPTRIVNPSQTFNRNVKKTEFLCVPKNLLPCRADISSALFFAVQVVVKINNLTRMFINRNTP